MFPPAAAPASASAPLPRGAGLRQLSSPGLGDRDQLLAAVVPAADGDPASVHQRAKVARQRRLVKRRQPAQVALPDLPGPREDAEQGILGRAQADAAQLLVVEPADGSRCLTQGVAKAWSGGQVVVLGVHIRCICSESAVVKGRAVDEVPFRVAREVSVGGRRRYFQGHHTYL